ncbi:cytochrome c3 family protein [Neobacillus sp. 19]|uniref:cytochrome c3 family protein n=1 Tax=Neobacillus sp. 19 TaxID=3394458 RepID=UPI003BF65447
MSKMKVGLSTILMLAIFSLFSIVAFAAAPAKPEVTSKLIAPTTVELSWKAVPGATSYNVYWNRATTPVSVTDTKYKVENLDNSKYYVYAVTAVNAEGESAQATGDQAFMHSATVKSDGTVGTHRIHGDFQNNTNACANCHSTHNGNSADLLKYTSAEYDMCLSCHDGTLGFYNVLGQGAGGGTFNDTHQSSSMHNVKSGVKIGEAPGGNTIKGTAEAKAELECSSCHNPHGSVNDRLLKESVAGGQNYAGVAKGIKGVTLDLVEDPAYAELNASTNAGIKVTISKGPKANTDIQNYSKFCSACHDDYLKSSGSQRVDGHYTHTTNSASAGRNCASCHFAHGTDITLMKDTQGKTIADYMKNDGWSQDKAEAYMKDVNKSSALKKYTNMSVCWACHISSHKLDTQQPDSKYTYPGTDREGNPVNMFPGRPAK